MTIDYKAFLSLDRVAVVDELPSRKTALHQLAESLARGHASLSYREVFFKLEEREREGSTVLDEFPIAIPHCRMPNCPSPIGSLLKLPQGHSVDFGGQDVQLAIGMCFPLDGSEEALAVLRLIVRLLDDEHTRQSILATDSREVLFESFRDRFLVEAEA